MNGEKNYVLFLCIAIGVFFSLYTAHLFSEKIDLHPVSYQDKSRESDTFASQQSFLSGGKVGIYLLGGYGYSSFSAINDVTTSWGDKDISKNWGWDWGIGLRVWLAKVVALEIGYGENYTIGRWEFTYTLLSPPASGYLGSEVILSYIPINIIFSILDNPTANIQLGLGIINYSATYFFYFENDDGSNARYLEAEGSATRLAFILRGENFISKQFSITGGILLRLGVIPEFKDTAYGETVYIKDTTYGKDFTLDYTDAKSPLEINLTGFRIMWGINFYFN